MSTAEASSTILQAVDDFEQFLKNNGYGRGTGSRQMFAERTGKSQQYISHVLGGREHGKAAFDTLNQIFLIVGYKGSNWVIHR
ncbi:XRE family transcriptional regulator [Weissella confusa]|uniref:XRE family transcriptional regulator n=1 Tax=Weissella confusa TaxID=1583 RepID=UPI00376F016E